jgi:hypothetical protein
MRKEVMVRISDAKYYQAQGSIVIVGVEVETGRPITQQITMMAFLENLGVFSPEEIATVLGDHDRCRYFASQLRDRRDPFRLLFEDSKTDKDDI